MNRIFVKDISEFVVPWSITDSNNPTTVTVAEHAVENRNNRLQHGKLRVKIRPKQFSESIQVCIRSNKVYCRSNNKKKLIKRNREQKCFNLQFRYFDCLASCFPSHQPNLCPLKLSRPTVERYCIHCLWFVPGPQTRTSSRTS